MSDLKRLDEALAEYDESRKVAALYGVPFLVAIAEAARAYHDLQTNGQRDMGAAMQTALELGVKTSMLKLEAIVDAAIGDKLLIDPPTTEEER